MKTNILVLLLYWQQVDYTVTYKHRHTILPRMYWKQTTRKTIYIPKKCQKQLYVCHS